MSAATASHSIRMLNAAIAVHCFLVVIFELPLLSYAFMIAFGEFAILLLSSIKMDGSYLFRFVDAEAEATVKNNVASNTMSLQLTCRATEPFIASGHVVCGPALMAEAESMNSQQRLIAAMVLMPTCLEMFAPSPVQHGLAHKIEGDVTRCILVASKQDKLNEYLTNHANLCPVNLNSEGVAMEQVYMLKEGLTREAPRDAPVNDTVLQNRLTTEERTVLFQTATGLGKQAKRKQGMLPHTGVILEDDKTRYEFDFQ